MPSRSTPPCLRKNVRPYTAGVKRTRQETRPDIWLGTGTLPSRTSTFTCRLGPSARAASRPIRKLSFRAETDYLLSPSSGRILRAANIVDNVTEDCALQQAS